MEAEVSEINANNLWSQVYAVRKVNFFSFKKSVNIAQKKTSFLNWQFISANPARFNSSWSHNYWSVQAWKSAFESLPRCLSLRPFKNCFVWLWRHRLYQRFSSRGKLTLLQASSTLFLQSVNVKFCQVSSLEFPGKKRQNLSCRISCSNFVAWT